MERDMIAKLELELKCKEELSYQMASLFHGALMELLPEEYAQSSKKNFIQSECHGAHKKRTI